MTPCLRMLMATQNSREATMKDGRYIMQLSAGTYQGAGHLDLAGNYGHGHDGSFAVQLHLNDTSQHFRGIANILMSPEILPDSSMPEHFSLTMSGTADECSFTLVGTGPMGIVVGLSGTWSSVARRDD